MALLDGKVCIVTGAGRGIGRDHALALAKRGAKVIVNDPGVAVDGRGTDNAPAQQVVDEIKAAGGEAEANFGSVSNFKDCEALIQQAWDKWGKLDVLINNAGIGPISLLDDLRVEDWEEMIDVNIKGVLFGIAAALPIFRTQGFGHFVNIVSTAGLKIVPLQSVYAGTKNAVRTISEGLRQEAGEKLRVTLISPGIIRTNLPDSMTDPVVKAQVLEKMGDIAIPPEAIGRAIAFAIEQPAEVDVSEIVVRPTAQA